MWRVPSVTTDGSHTELSTADGVDRHGEQLVDVEANVSGCEESRCTSPKPSTHTLTQLEQLVNAGMALSRAYLEKYLGGKVSLPPRVDWRLSYVAWVGCFVTIACWQVMTDAINQTQRLDGLFSLPGSFGALCTLVFALPSAPLAQPRVIFLAHTWSIAVGVAFTLIFPPMRYIWLQKACVLAISVAGMAKMGILNPPAGAVSMIIKTFAASPTYTDEGLLCLVLSIYLGCAVVVTVAVVWHNLFLGKTYPQYW
jgi:CBS-domain-containing membrane protein